VTKPEAVSSEVSNTFMFTFLVGVKVEVGEASSDVEHASFTSSEARTVVVATPKRVLPTSREEAAHIWERCKRPRLQAEMLQRKSVA